MRSLWKGFFFNKIIIEDLNNVILQPLLNKTLSLYAGKRRLNILIKSSMLYLKIGSLVFTRKISVQHKKKEKKGKKSLTKKK